MPEPESGRCARCKENTVLERIECEDCKGYAGPASGIDGGEWCTDCNGRGYTESTPCCGRELLDEADAVDDAYERWRDLDIPRSL